MKYSQGQIKAAKDRFELLEVCNSDKVSDSQAIAFLDYHFVVKSEFPCGSELEAIVQGLKHGSERLNNEKLKMYEILGYS